MNKSNELASSLFLQEKDGLFLASPKKGIIIGYSSKIWGDGKEKTPFFSNIKEVYHQSQKHTSLVIEVPSQQEFPLAFDGTITKKSNILLKGLFADCLPLYFFSLKGDWIGLAHSGWQGSLEGIGKNIVDSFLKKGLLAKEIGCVLGPYRSLLYYEVKKEFKDLFIDKYPYSWIEDCFKEKDGLYFFDNGIFNLLLLKNLGLDHLYYMDIDMGVHTEFFSHRRGELQRNVAFIFKED